jgi:hypothetical protein
MNIDMGYVLPTWDMGYRYGYLPYRYGHPGYRYGIWANDMGDDSIDTVISQIAMGYLVTLPHWCLAGLSASPPVTPLGVAAQVEIESNN